MRTEVRSEHVLTKPDDLHLMEGSRFYKINGNYYIFVTRPPNGQYVWKSTSGPFGPYKMREVLLDLPGPIPGGGIPHQGSLVDTPNGDWYYMGFIDAYPGGRVPALAPVTWNAEGWPELQKVDGTWGETYPYPVTPHPLPPMTGADTFEGTALAPYWEWNHNPDTAAFTVDNGLTLRTATVTDDLYSARNTLTRRIQGPASTATAVLDCSGMADGDRAGLAMLRDSSAWIGVTRQNGVSRLVMFDGLTMDASWNTSSTGTERARAQPPRVRQPRLAARRRRHQPGAGPPGDILLQHRRHHLHPARPGLHHERAASFLHGLPLRRLQPRHPGPRRRSAGGTLRVEHALTM